jgi:hypothetical protein
MSSRHDGRADDAARLSLGDLPRRTAVVTTRQAGLSWVFVIVMSAAWILVSRSLAIWTGPIVVPVAVVAFVSLAWASALATALAISLRSEPRARMLSAFGLVALVAGEAVFLAM